MQCSNGNAKQSSRTGNLFLVSLQFIIVFVFFLLVFIRVLLSFVFSYFVVVGFWLLVFSSLLMLLLLFFSIPLNLLFYHFFRCTSVFRTWAAGSLYFGILLFIMTTSLCFSPPLWISLFWYGIPLCLPSALSIEEQSIIMHYKMCGNSFVENGYAAFFHYIHFRIHCECFSEIVYLLHFASFELHCIK